MRSDRTERYCRNGEEVGDRYTCTYGCPVNQDGQGICSKAMLLLFPLMEPSEAAAIWKRSGSGPIARILCVPTAAFSFADGKKLGNENFFKGNFLD